MVPRSVGRNEGMVASATALETPREGPLGISGAD